MSVWSEIRRELQWAWHSLMFHLTAAAAILFGIWMYHSAVTEQTNTKKEFASSLAQSAAIGESLEDALSHPLEITVTPDGGQLIHNPLRYSYEALTQAASVLSAPGMVSNTLSTACFLLIPFAGFAVGMASASHDLRSGGIVLRWPQTMQGAFLTSKIAMGVGLMLALVAVGSLTSCILGAFWGGADTTYPPAPAPSLLHLLALAGFAVLIGAVFILFGLLVGSIFTERIIPLVTFFRLYYLIPLFGEWDPRQWITASGKHVIHYVGGLQIPEAKDALLPSMLLLAMAALSLAGVLMMWGWRSKMPTRGVT